MYSAAAQKQIGPHLHCAKIAQKEGKMKKIFVFTLIVMALAACAAPQTPAPTATAPAALDLAPTATAPAAMPNPASVYCAQTGNKLEIRTAGDGSQYGVCLFPDGSTCDEWAYYRGECGLAVPQSPTPAMAAEATPSASGGNTGENASGGYMAPGTSEAIADWWGVIRSTEPGAQYEVDDFAAVAECLDLRLHRRVD
jgi:uncharacterized protein